MTLAAASSLDKELKLEGGSDRDAAQKVGKLVAERAKKAGISKVLFPLVGNEEALPAVLPR